MDGDGDAPRLALSANLIVTYESLFADWKREVESVAKCGPHNISAWGYVHARKDQIGKLIKDVV